ncbi:MAG: hypothetical protein JWO24_3927 [Rhodospirillales bacterium]|jgi:hypothetical protein|nr:hypothetical protein [Rhodospirillales bacterium]
MGQIGTKPKNSTTWCAGLWDFGKLNNTQTGQQGELQLHATITMAGTAAGVGFHLSAYALGGGGYVLSDWDPANAMSRRYYEPTGLATGQFRHKAGHINRTPATIANMTYLATMESEAWAYFLTLYPAYKAPVVFTVKKSDFPALGS